jgi:hypothetical protein
MGWSKGEEVITQRQVVGRLRLRIRARAAWDMCLCLQDEELMVLLRW